MSELYIYQNARCDNKKKIDGDICCEVDNRCIDSGIWHCYLPSRCRNNHEFVWQAEKLT